MTEEIWKDIPDYNGKYQVSNLGRIKSLKQSPPIILKQMKNKSKYAFVNLDYSRKHRVQKVHVLVAEVFLGHTPQGRKLVVDHIDNNHLNNHADNLQIVTMRQNIIKDTKRGSSRFVGVCWIKRQNQWKSTITINGKIKHLGYFDNEIAAHNKYQEALAGINKP